MCWQPSACYQVTVLLEPPAGEVYYTSAQFSLCKNRRSQVALITT